MLFVKNTFFIMYFQLFWLMQWLRVCVYIGGLFMTTFYIGFTVGELVIVIPRRGESLISHDLGQLYKMTIPVSVSLAAVGFVIEAYILLLPIVAVSRLHLRPRQKVGVTLIFMFGILSGTNSFL